MKIYTRTGDHGETSLFSGGRIRKDHARLHAYGTVDELNSILGLVVALGVHEDLRIVITRIQGELMRLGSDLATPLDAQTLYIQRVDATMTDRLEQEIDQFEMNLPELKNFILPGGTAAAAALHQARTVCRRAERWMVLLNDEINVTALQYTNRLSDWLFVVSRYENWLKSQSEDIWVQD